MKKISFVVPVYNSEKTLETLVEKIDLAVEKLEENYVHEIILVNDYSKDNSLELCRKLNRKFAHVKYLSFSKNFGQPHALIAGFNHVKGDYIICLDDDLQTPPEEINKLISKLEEGAYDVVYGKYNSKKHSLFRNFGSYTNQKMARCLINMPENINTTSFFIARRFVIDEVVKYDKHYPHIPGLIFRITNNIANVLVEHKNREYGKSNYNMRKLIKLWFYGFTNFSVKPLRLSSFFGMVLSGMSFFMVVFLTIRKLMNPQVQLGWTSLMIMITFFGGIQLLSIGLLGEYVGRIFMSINKSPQYVIKERFVNNEVVEIGEKDVDCEVKHAN